MKRKRDGERIAEWTPFQLATLPDRDRVAMAAINDFRAETITFLNSRYQVMATPYVHDLFGRICELSIKSIDKSARHDWRDFQRIKNEICGDECEAIEIYPAESRLVDTANQFYLWVFYDWIVPLGFKQRLVSEGDGSRSRQRPFEKGARPRDCISGSQLDEMIAAEIARRVERADSEGSDHG